MSALRRITLVSLTAAVWLPQLAAAQGATTPSEALLAKVQEQTRSLEAREREVEARELAAAELEREALRILDEVRSVRQVIERRLEEWEETKGDRVARLAKVYSEMPPDRAAPLLESLGQDLAVEVVARMKPKDSAGVLALMSDPSALRISRSVAKPLAPREGGGDN